MSASFFTHRLMLLNGNPRTASTLQEAAAACQEVGSDILHFIPEGDCRIDSGSKFASRDVNAQKLQRYEVMCQRKKTNMQSNYRFFIQVPIYSSLLTITEKLTAWDVTYKAIDSHTNV